MVFAIELKGSGYFYLVLFLLMDVYTVIIGKNHSNGSIICKGQG